VGDWCAKYGETSNFQSISYKTLGLSYKKVHRTMRLKQANDIDVTLLHRFTRGFALFSMSKVVPLQKYCTALHLFNPIFA
jgi:hypothetical protein